MADGPILGTLLGFLTFLALYCLYRGLRSREEFRAAQRAERRRVELHGTMVQLKQYGDKPPHVATMDPPKSSDMPENVREALSGWIETCLRANGNHPLNLRSLMIEFAKWHGVRNLERGILKPVPPPIPGQFKLEEMEPVDEV